MRRKRISTTDLSKQVEAQGRAIRALQRKVRVLIEKVDVKPVDAIGFRMDREEETDDDDDG